MAAIFYLPARKNIRSTWRIENSVFALTLKLAGCGQHERLAWGKDILPYLGIYGKMALI